MRERDEASFAVWELVWINRARTESHSSDRTSVRIIEFACGLEGKREREGAIEVPAKEFCGKLRRGREKDKERERKGGGGGEERRKA